MPHYQKKVSFLALTASLAFLLSCSETPLPPGKDKTTVALPPQPVESPHEQRQIIEMSSTLKLAGQEQPPPSARSTAAPRRLLEREKDSLYAGSIGKTVQPAVTDSDQQAGNRTWQLQTESYTPVQENRFIATANDPLSTFSIDVDTASYSTIRRYINEGSLPPVGAVRIEEMINYFSYDYKRPSSGPLTVAAEVGPAPWHPGHRLVKIGLQAATLNPEEVPPSNLVFLIDVSGSMQDSNKLPLLQQSMLLLLEQLTPRDRVAIVVYAGTERVALPPTPGDRKMVIRQAIESLTAGGSTHGSSGIRTAYSLAEQVFMVGGNNRVILASDGDFNVGVTDRGELQQLISDKRQSGVYLTVLGFGMGNYHDDTMEILADSGNGNYAYIDSLLEAKKVLIKERTSTLFTLARDVKIQVEFNPALVGGYRLIGYENRILADEDFQDDTSDAGEIGLGHSVTALYELIPPGSDEIPPVAGLKYQKPALAIHHNDELLNIKVRYKPAGRDSSLETGQVVRNSTKTLAAASDDFRFAASVAAFGMLLKGSSQTAAFPYEQVLAMARSSRGPDAEGYRAEFVRLVEMAELLDRQRLLSHQQN